MGCAFDSVRLIDVANIIEFSKLTLDEVHKAFLEIEEYAKIDFDTTGDSS